MENEFLLAVEEHNRRSKNIDKEPASSERVLIRIGCSRLFRHEDWLYPLWHFDF